MNKLSDMKDYQKADEGLPFTTTQIRAELYLCRLIARLMGGDLRLDSDYKDGTRVILDIAAK